MTDLRPLLNDYITGLPESDADTIRGEMKNLCHQLEQKKLITRNPSAEGSFTGKRGGQYQTGPIWAQLTLDGEEAYKKAYGDQEQNKESINTGGMKQETEKALCPTCNKEQNASIRGAYTTSWSDPDHPLDGRDEYRIFQCNGCDTVFFQHRNYFSLDEEPFYDKDGNTQFEEQPTIHYYPYPSVRLLPAWIESISDELLKNILSETYEANNRQLPVLTAIGLRTVFDRATTLLKINAELRFEEKLSLLPGQKITDNLRKESMTVLVNAGNAAAHRAWKPKQNDIDQLMDLMENFIHHHFVIHKKIKKIAKGIPARKKAMKIRGNNQPLPGKKETS